MTSGRQRDDPVLIVIIDNRVTSTIGYTFSADIWGIDG